MFDKIVEVSTTKVSGHTYVRACRWRNKAAFDAVKPPDRENDFLMQLRPTGVRVVTNAEGWLKRKSDGKFIDPATFEPDALGLEKPEPEWERETYDRDLPAEIWANIEAYFERAEAKGYPADHTARVWDFAIGGYRDTIERDNSDPHGVLARPDVKALRDAEVERL